MSHDKAWSNAIKRSQGLAIAASRAQREAKGTAVNPLSPSRPFDVLAFIRAMVADPEERVEWVKCLQWLHSLKTHEPSRLLRWDKEEA